MDLDEYVKQVVELEHTPDEVKVNGRLLINSLALFVSAGQLLNQVKLKLIDHKKYDGELIHRAFDTAKSALTDIDGTRLMGEDDVYDVDPQIFHGIIGIAATSAELCEALCNVMLHNHDFKMNYNLLLELGEINQYQALMMQSLDGDWEEMIQTNLKILQRLHDERKEEQDK